MDRFRLVLRSPRHLSAFFHALLFHSSLSSPSSLLDALKTMKLTALVSLALLGAANASPIQPRATCSSYTIISTRGTGEIQGPSTGFISMNQQVQSAVSGGKVYNTVYPASFTQISTAGTADIIRKINSVLSSNPSECFILQGYSQGAAATVDAMPKLTGANFDAVKGVVLIGNPKHRSGLACNVDGNGGTTTKFVNGLSAALGQIPDNWVSKSLDICIYGDGVCDTTHGLGINLPHLAYPTSTSVQRIGADYIKKALGA
ncbi:hypothetical protein ACQY0O_007521 [Thecaphora frezii]